MTARPPASPAFLLFRLSGVRFGVRLASVREVAPYCTLSRPPSRPPFVEGLLDLRGAAIPVVRLERLLSLAEAAPRLSSLLIVLRPEDGGLALLADEVTGIRELSPEERLEAPAATSFNGCVDGTALDSGDPLYLLSLERLLLLRERQAAEHFQALEQARMASEVAEAR